MNLASKLNWGVLGAARITERMIPAILEAKNANLTAIASRRPGAAAETLSKYVTDSSGISVYEHLDALLSDPHVQAVYLPLANHEHASWTLRAIEHGKHVLCEKPMALLAEEITAIKQAAINQQVKVMEGFMYRFHPQHLRVLEIINAGLIGEVRSVRSNFSFMMRPARMYRLQDDITRGGGAMWDIGCYAIHSLRLFFPQLPLAVTAMAKYVESGADTAMSGILDYGDGKFAQFDFSFERARRCEYEIIGTLGGVKCHIVWQLPGDVPIISWWQENGPVTEERLPASNHFKLEFEHFSHCVLNNQTPALSLNDAEDNCRIINAAILSAAEGRRIVL